MRKNIVCDSPLVRVSHNTDRLDGTPGAFRGCWHCPPSGSHRRALRLRSNFEVLTCTSLLVTVCRESCFAFVLAARAGYNSGPVGTPGHTSYRLSAVAVVQSRHSNYDGQNCFPHGPNSVPNTGSHVEANAAQKGNHEFAAAGATSNALHRVCRPFGRHTCGRKGKKGHHRLAAAGAASTALRPLRAWQ